MLGGWSRRLRAAVYLGAECFVEPSLLEPKGLQNVCVGVGGGCVGEMGVGVCVGVGAGARLVIVHDIASRRSRAASNRVVEPSSWKRCKGAAMMR